MTARAVLGVALVLAGAFLDVPIAIGLGTVTVGFEVVRRFTAGGGTASIGYRRRLHQDRVPWGEAADLTIEVWNRSRLPRSWVRTDDAISEDAVVHDRRLLPGEHLDLTLRNTWTLGPRELARRRLRVGGRRRGVYEIGPTEIGGGDLFAMPAGADTRAVIDRYIVWPRTVPAPALARRERWGGVDRSRRGLSEDPARFVGIRDYEPGDPVRRIHARASARLGRPMSKRFEPSRDRDVLVVVDLEGPEPTPSRGSDGASGNDAADGSPAPRLLDPVEDLIVIAASLVRALGESHAAFGVAASGYGGPRPRIAWLPVASSRGQLERGLDLLARVAPRPGTSFDRLAAFVGRAARDGATVLVLTTRDATAILASLRRLQRRGLDMGLLATGDDGPTSVRAARAAGIRADLVRLDGPWQDATRVALAS